MALCSPPAALVSGMSFTDALIALTFVYHEWERVINVPEARTTVCLILSDSCLDMFHKCPRKELSPSIIKRVYWKGKGGPKLRALWLPTCLLMKTLLFLHNTRKKTICSLWCSNQVKSFFNNNFICSRIYNTHTHTSIHEVWKSLCKFFRRSTFLQLPNIQNTDSIWWFCSRGYFFLVKSWQSDMQNKSCVWILQKYHFGKRETKTNWEII